MARTGTRISQGHDSAAALVIDGKIVAAVAEERLCRKKQTGEFPAQAISCCLREAGIGIEDVDEIARAYIECPVRHIFDEVGDHAVVILEVVEAEYAQGVNPLMVATSPWEYGG